MSLIAQTDAGRGRRLSRRAALLSVAGLPLAGLSLVSCAKRTNSPDAGRTVSGPASSAGAALPPVRYTYGDDPSQWADLYRPRGASHAGTIVVIHGGFWLAQYGASLGAPLAADLAARGYTAWNLEYRRVGKGGGWPATLLDVASGIDRLETIDVDTSKVVVIGHSAGGQLAAWAGGRPKLPADAPGAHPRIAVTAVVAQAGVLDLVGADRDGVGGTAVRDFLGGTAEGQPERYRIASPLAQVPISVPVRCVHSHSDLNVPFEQSEIYVQDATKAGGDAALTVVPGDHFDLIDVHAQAWHTVIEMLPDLLP